MTNKSRTVLRCVEGAKCFYVGVLEIIKAGKGVVGAHMRSHALTACQVKFQCLTDVVKSICYSAGH
jgi:hypothetical protein